MARNAKNNNTVLIIDGGGRGAALAHAYSKSPFVKKILSVPGNDLMCINTRKQILTFPSIKTTDSESIIKICKKEKVDLIDVCQDNAVEAGLVDTLTREGFNVIGPTRNAGQIEWDKGWARNFMKKYNLPIPLFKICKTEKEGLDFIQLKSSLINHSLENENNPSNKWFIKAAGLAEGKGVLPGENLEKAKLSIKRMSQFGTSGSTYVIEEWLTGEEFSAFAISDGITFKIIGYAKDYKRAFNFDEGPNTGGMGCISHPQIVTDTIKKQVHGIFKKTFDGLKKEGKPYRGILYLGGMVVHSRPEFPEKMLKQAQHNSIPKVYIIEFNARWGDPETQVIAPSIKADFFTLGMAISKQKLSKFLIKTDKKVRVVVAGCAHGYPTDYSRVNGKLIFGLEEVMKDKNGVLYGAGVAVKKKYRNMGKKILKQRKRAATAYYAQGGRLFHIVANGKNIHEARRKVYSLLSQVYIEGNNLQYRTDIGWNDVEKEYIKRV